MREAQLNENIFILMMFKSANYRNAKNVNRQL